MRTGQGCPVQIVSEAEAYFLIEKVIILTECMLIIMRICVALEANKSRWERRCAFASLPLNVFLIKSILADCKWLSIKDTV